jgi:phosphoenolpyruvate carboxykinase (ATP)
MSKYLKIKSPAEAQAKELKSEFGLQNQGLKHLKRAYWNLPMEALYEEFVFRGEGSIANAGPMVVNTGKWSARAANDKFVVQDQGTEDVWWGEYNRPITSEKFAGLFTRMQAYLQGEEVFVQDCYAGHDEEHQLPVRVVTEFAWQSHFARNMFILPHQPGGVPGVHPRLHRHRAAQLQGRPHHRRHPERDGHHPELPGTPRPHRRFQLRR